METTNEISKKRVHHGHNVASARNISGLKQSVLADILGVSQQRMSQLEAQRVIRDEILEKISQATGVSVEDLKTMEEPMSVYIENNNTISNPTNIANLGVGDNIDRIENYNPTGNNNPIEKIVELYERLLKEKQERIEALEKRIEELSGQKSE